jgi:hypothetical protein
MIAADEIPPPGISPSGAIIGEFSDYDGLIDRLRERAAALGVPYRVLDELTGLGEGGTAKYLADLHLKHLSIRSMLRITSALGVKAVLVIDEGLVREMRPLWDMSRRARAKRLAPLGQRTVQRVLPEVAKEMGRRGGSARMQKLSPHLRRRLARLAARARWQNRETP